MKRLCTFQIGPHACALDVDDVLEIVRPGPPSPVPLAPAGVSGLVSVRGQVYTAFDLRARLGLPPRTRPEAPYGLVMPGDLCLLADEVGQVGALDPSRFETPSEALPASIRALVAGEYRGRRNRYLVLRADRIRP